MLPSGTLSTTLQLTVECQHLPKLDALSASDPFVVLFELGGKEKTEKKEKKSKLGRTETRRDESDPRFAHMFEVPYHFEEVQQLRFDVYDDDKEGAVKLKKHQRIGRASVQLGQVACARGRSAQLALSTKDGKACVGKDGKSSVIIVKVEEVREATKDVVFIEPRCEKLKKMDFFGKSDPYMELHRVNDGGDTQVVYSSTVQKNTLDPNWGVVELPVAKVCNGDYNRSLQARVFDWDKSGEPDAIGQCPLTLRQLLDCAKPLKIELRLPEKPEDHKRGALVIDAARVEKRSSFMDYLRGGLRLQLSVAIDFTASNGDPRSPSGLHYMGPEGNDYLRVIRSVGAVLQPYDADNMIAVYGFGGRLPGYDQASHCFPLCGTPLVPPEQARVEVPGVEGVAHVYYNALQRVTLYGPTLFSEVLEAFRRAASSATPSDYHILLIITDGVITDFDETVAQIVQASHQPTSIVIVGVGDADFSEMEALDADGSKPLKDRHGRSAARDIVQFVPFNQFRANQSRLAAHTLKEIPGQIERYMWINGIEPAAAQPVADY